MTINKNTTNQVPLQFKIGKLYTHEELEHLKWLASNSTHQEERKQAEKQLAIHEQGVLITKQNIIDLAASFKIPIVKNCLKPTFADLKNLYEHTMNLNSKRQQDAAVMLTYLGAQDPKVEEYMQALHAEDWKQVADNIGIMRDSFAESLATNKLGKM